MRIAFDYHAFMLQPYGGISRYFMKLAQGLLEMEQEIGVFAPLHRNNYLVSLPQAVVHGRHINRYPSKTFRLFSAYNHIRSVHQIAKWQPDLVHETLYSRISVAPYGCSVVITIYDMIHELFPHEFAKQDNTATIKRIAIERADHVICISENTKRDLIRFYGTSDNKLSVVHLGFNQLAPQKNLLRFITPSGKPFILYVGQRKGYKNFLGFLRAVASSKRLLSDFDIVSFGEPKFSASELNAIHAMGFAENQILCKSGGDLLLGNLYSSARALVYPSLYEGFGLPPLEAMAHQCPVISSNTSSMPEVIGPAGEFFNPMDLDDIRRAIEVVVYSDSRVERLKALGSERLLNFSWDKCTRETFNIYSSLTNAT